MPLIQKCKRFFSFVQEVFSPLETTYFIAIPNEMLTIGIKPILLTPDFQVRTISLILIGIIYSGIKSILLAPDFQVKTPSHTALVSIVNNSQSLLFYTSIIPHYPTFLIEMEGR